MPSTPRGTIDYPAEGDTDWYNSTDGLEEWLSRVEVLGIPTYDTFADLPAGGSTKVVDAGTGQTQRQFAAVVDDRTIYRDDGSDWIPWMGRLAGENVVSVKEFGAVGDGAADDTQAFLDAIDELRGTGGKVYAPAGTYGLSGSLPLPSDVALVGDGNATKLVLLDTYTLDLITWRGTGDMAPIVYAESGSSHVTVKDLYIEGDRTSVMTDNRMAGVVVDGSDNFLAENVEVLYINLTEDLATQNSGFNFISRNCQDVTWRNCRAGYSGYECFGFWDNTTDGTAEKCRGYLGWRTVAQIHRGSSDIKFIDCDFEQAGNSTGTAPHSIFTLHGSNGALTSDITVRDCSLRTNDSHDVAAAQIVEQYTEHVTFVDTYMESLGSEIVRLRGDDVTLRGCTLVKCNNDGIVWLVGTELTVDDCHVVAGNHGTELQDGDVEFVDTYIEAGNNGFRSVNNPVDDVTIENGHITNNASAPSLVGEGDNWTVRGTRLTGDRGVYFRAGSSDITLDDVSIDTADRAGVRTGGQVDGLHVVNSDIDTTGAGSECIVYEPGTAGGGNDDVRFRGNRCTAPTPGSGLAVIKVGAGVLYPIVTENTVTAGDVGVEVSGADTEGAIVKDNNLDAAGTTTDVSAPDSVVQDNEGGTTLGWTEDGNSPDSASGVGSYTYNLAGEYDEVRVVMKVTKTSANSRGVDVRVNGVTSGSYDFRRADGSSDSNDRWFGAACPGNSEIVQRFTFDGRWTDGITMHREGGNLDNAGFSAIEGSNGAVASPLSSFTVLMTAAEDESFDIEVEVYGREAPW